MFWESSERSGTRTSFPKTEKNESCGLRNSTLPSRECVPPVLFSPCILRPRRQNCSACTPHPRRCTISTVTQSPACGYSRVRKNAARFAVAEHPTSCTSNRWLQHPRRLGSFKRAANRLEPLRGFQHPRSSSSRLRHQRVPVLGAESVTEHGYRDTSLQFGELSRSPRPHHG